MGSEVDRGQCAWPAGMPGMLLHGAERCCVTKGTAQRSSGIGAGWRAVAARHETASGGAPLLPGRQRGRRPSYCVLLRAGALRQPPLCDVSLQHPLHGIHDGLRTVPAMECGLELGGRAGCSELWWQELWWQQGPDAPPMWTDKHAGGQRRVLSRSTAAPSARTCVCASTSMFTSSPSRLSPATVTLHGTAEEGLGTCG